MKDERHTSSFEEILNDEAYQQAQHEAAFEKLIRQLLRFVKLGLLTIFLWGFIQTIFQHRSTDAVLRYVLGFVVSGFAGAVLAYLFSLPLSFIPIKKLPYKQRQMFWLAVGALLVEAFVIVLLILLRFL